MGDTVGLSLVKNLILMNMLYPETYTLLEYTHVSGYIPNLTIELDQKLGIIIAANSDWSIFKVSCIIKYIIFQSTSGY